MVQEIQEELLRRLPAVDELLREPALEAMQMEGVPRPMLVDAIREILGVKRKKILRGELKTADLERSQLIMEIQQRIKAAVAPKLRPVINATGVVLHTNLGRAPLSKAAREAVRDVSCYCNLELDLTEGTRGSRYSHVEELLCRLTGAEAALVVNNNAAAVLLALSTLAAGRKVIVSRGQLVEIGGSFRIPDVMAQSGARLVEVGTTNKTYISDYRQAMDQETSLFLHVHTSNYRIIGFTHEVEVAELVELGREANIPVMSDLGSGFLVDLKAHGLPEEPTVQRIIAQGAGVVTFSGDKLLGGPQAGIIVGKRTYLDMMKKHPLNRALRIDKFTIAALEATMRAYLNPETVLQELPTLRMLTLPRRVLDERAAALAEGLRKTVGEQAEVVIEEGFSQVGGGAMPLAQLPTRLIALKPYQTDAATLAKRLRLGKPALIGRIQEGRFLLDPRTIQDEEETEVVHAVARALRI